LRQPSAPGCTSRRQLLLVTEGAVTALYAIFALLVALGLVSPGLLLLFTFLIAAGGALAAPAWQSIVPQLVPKQDLPPAVAAYSVGINISRAVGSALGGAITAALGTAAPFCLDAVAGLGITGALLWWRCPQKGIPHLPAERFASALRASFRNAVGNSDLRATLMRAVGFFLFGSAYWALLPLVARHQIAGGPELYGVLLGAIGAGGVGGALALPWLKARLGPDRLVAAATLAEQVLSSTAKRIERGCSGSARIMSMSAWRSMTSLLPFCSASGRLVAATSSMIGAIPTGGPRCGGELRMRRAFSTPRRRVRPWARRPSTRARVRG
jgi:MFS family permease